MRGKKKCPEEEGQARRTQEERRGVGYLLGIMKPKLSQLLSLVTQPRRISFHDPLFWRLYDQHVWRVENGTRATSISQALRVRSTGV